MLLIQDGRREERASSSLLFEFERLRMPGRLGGVLPCSAEGGVGVLGWALVGDCFASEREGGVTATGADFLPASGVVEWPLVCGRLVCDEVGGLVSLDRPGEDGACLRCCCSVWRSVLHFLPIATRGPEEVAVRARLMRRSLLTLVRRM